MASLTQKLMRTLRKPVEVNEHAELERIERARRAEELLKDEFLSAAFRDLEEAYLRAWRGTDALDVELRERCHISVCVLDDVRNHLLSFVRDGAAARAKLTRAQRGA